MYFIFFKQLTSRKLYLEGNVSPILSIGGMHNLILYSEGYFGLYMCSVFVGLTLL